MENIGKIIKFVQEFSLKRNEQPIGYLDEEMREFKEKIGKKLPNVYLEYLSKLGKDNPGLNDSLSTSIEKISKIGDELEEKRIYYTKNEFPIYNEEEMFVFMNDDAGNVFFFYFNDDLDPQIFTYDQEMKIQAMGGSFTEFIKARVEHHTDNIVWLEKRRES